MTLWAGKLVRKAIKVIQGIWPYPSKHPHFLKTVWPCWCTVFGSMPLCLLGCSTRALVRSFHMSSELGTVHAPYSWNFGPDSKQIMIKRNQFIKTFTFRLTIERLDWHFKVFLLKCLLLFPTIGYSQMANHQNLKIFAFKKGNINECSQQHLKTVLITVQPHYFPQLQI